MKKVLIILPAFIVLLVFMTWFFGKCLLKRSVAEHKGTIEISTIKNNVEITFDGKGIPQVWAKTDYDMYFALGWLHASERLFQMELVRRLVAGELSELIGGIALAMDFQQRQIGFLRKAKNDQNSLSDNNRQSLQSYCNGINAWIEHKSILPPEFIILRNSPKKWEPVDCISIGLYQTWYSHKLMAKDERYQTLIDSLGMGIESILQTYKNWSPPTVHESFLKNIFPFSNFPLRMAFASNSWIVSPQKSVSGAAIHASDPHLVIDQVPGFWYIVGLHSEEGVDALGITVAGLPMLAMGHTGKIAYAFTVASVDVIDHYQYVRNPKDTLQIFTENGIRNLKVEQIQISVRDRKKPVVRDIYFGPEGPVVVSDSEKVVVIKWAGYDFNASKIIENAFNLIKVDNFSDFRKTVTNLGALDVNWTYSDINGNIGYQLGTPIPIRKYRNTYSVLNGADPSLKWQGYHELEERPYLLNPEDNWLATCNNQIVPENWPYPIPGFYDPYRIVRISALLSLGEKFSVKDFEKMQLDRISVAGTKWQDLVAEGAKKLNNNDLASRFSEWDGEMKGDENIPAIFGLWWKYLPKVIFQDELGAHWHIGGTIFDNVMEENKSPFIDNQNTVDIVENLIDISAAALDSVLSKVDGKNYGAISQLNIRHPLSTVKILDSWINLNRGPISMSGDFSSLNANLTVYNWKHNKLETKVGPSMRFILDWSDVDGFTINTNLGQSGNPFSPHYDDFLEMWHKGERWNVPFSKDKVYANKKSLLILKATGR
jgi:penicillin amidase